MFPAALIQDERWSCENSSTALVVIPLGVFFVIFAVANRHLVTVSFDPFNSVDADGRGDAAAVCRDHRGRGHRRGGRRHGDLVPAGPLAPRRAPARGRGPAGAVATGRPAHARPPAAASSSGFWRRFRAVFTGPPGETSRARRCRTRPVTTLSKTRFRRPGEPCPCSSRFAACPRARRSTSRLRLAPTWWGSCSFRRRRGICRSRRRANSAALPKAAPTKVALTVDADDATFENIIDALKPDILQIHGKETTARFATSSRSSACPS